MPTESSSHSHHKSSQSSRFLLLAVPFLLVLILLTVAISVGVKKQDEEDLSQYPVETGEYVEEDGVMEEGDGYEELEQFPQEPEQARAYGVVTNTSDPGWQEYKPQNVQMEKQTDGSVKVSWDYQQRTPFPILVLIGYSDKSFDAIEKFEAPGKSSNHLRWVPRSHSAPVSSDWALLERKRLGKSDKPIQFVFYVGVDYGNGNIANYVYGANDSANKTFTVR